MIISEEEIKLSERQNKYITSGWGSEILKNTKVKRIVYESDDQKVNGYLAFPVDTNLKYPLIIWNRGGYRKDGLIDEFLARGIFGEIASWGYVVLASDYRAEDEFGGKDVNDILNLIPLAEEISFCDSSNIGMEGWSRGGMMTYIVLSRTGKIKCSVIISGLADLLRNENYRSDMKNVYRRLFGREDENVFKERMMKRSAVFFADRVNRETKILLIHGTSDEKVSYNDSVEMHEKLISNGVECELKLIENGDHYLKKDRVYVSALRREWFDKYLNN